MVKNLAAVLVSCLVLSGCDQVAKLAEAAKPLPKLEYEVNLSSPDNALKSWWNYLDAKAKYFNNRCLAAKEEMKELLTFRNVSTGEMITSQTSTASVCQQTVFSREIKEIKQETDTRAIAFVKVTNATPTRLEPTATEEKRRNEGEEYKYLIEKVGTDWKVAQVYRYNSSYKYLNLDSPWVKEYKEYQPSYPVYVHSQQ